MFSPLLPSSPGGASWAPLTPPPPPSSPSPQGRAPCQEHEPATREAPTPYCFPLVQGGRQGVPTWRRWWVPWAGPASCWCSLLQDLPSRGLISHGFHDSPSSCMFWRKNKRAWNSFVKFTKLWSDPLWWWGSFLPANGALGEKKLSVLIELCALPGYRIPLSFDFDFDLDLVIQSDEGIWLRLGHLFVDENGCASSNPKVHQGSRIIIKKQRKRGTLKESFWVRWTVQPLSSCGPRDENNTDYDEEQII